jgi:hypothetical protein
MNMIFRTILSSANFAFNCSEGDSKTLALMFPGMTEQTARNILAAGPGVCRRTAQNEIDVPDRLCEQPELKGTA